MPGSAPGVGLQEDELARGAGVPDAVHGRLVQVGNELVVHVVVLVVRVEDDELVVDEAGRDRLPPGLEAGGVGDDLLVVAA